jgi:hypothetical protein
MSSDDKRLAKDLRCSEAELDFAPLKKQTSASEDQGKGAAQAIMNFVNSYAQEIPPRLHQDFLEHMIRALQAFRSGHQKEIAEFLERFRTPK